MWDTANMYIYSDPTRTPSFAYQEEIIGMALQKVGRDNIVIATKTGIEIKISEEQGLSFTSNSTPTFIRQQCEDSLKRLQVDCIDVFYLHRIDPDTPIEVSMLELKKLVNEGKIKYIGLSECSSTTLRRACKIHPVSVIQMEYSVWCRGIEKELLPSCKELNVGLVAYSPLGRGFLTPKTTTTTNDSKKFDDGDFRRMQARMMGDTGRKNAEYVKKLEEFATSKNVSVAQLSLAWLRHKGKELGVTVVAIPGTTKSRHLESNAESTEMELSYVDMRMIEKLVPWEEIEGDRYSDDHPMSTWENDRNRELTEEDKKQFGL